LYPYLPIESHARVAVAAAGLLAVSAVVVWAAWRGRRYPAVGWFWFLGTLVPAIGLIQAGEQSMADRYTYVPLVGLFIVLTWGAADLLAPWRHRAALAAAVALPLLAACFILTMRQVGYWHNSETLLRHTLDVTTGNAITHNNLGNVLSMYQGRHAEAVPEYEEALRINPNYAEGHNNLANALSALGRADDALRHYQETLRINPDYNMARFNMGNLFLNRGEPQKAMALYQEALAHQPDYADALAGMGNAAVNLGQLEDAKRYFRQALHINPEHPGALTNLAVVLIIQGRTQEAEDHYRQVLQTHPNWLLGLNHLASLLATAADPACRNGAEAVQLAERACSLTGGRNPYLLDTLAAAYAEAGRFDQAVAAAKAAAALADANLAGQVQARLQLYQRRQPYHLPR
jgi:tetratricopeptide (TPR) repeat protein